MTTPDTLTTERILNAAAQIGVPVEKYGWRLETDAKMCDPPILRSEWVSRQGRSITLARDATPADRKAIICEIVERLYELGWRLEWTDTLYAGRPTWQWLPGMVGVVRDAAFDTAAVNAALKVGGEG